jgi:hypothetical protein
VAVFYSRQVWLATTRFYAAGTAGFFNDSPHAVHACIRMRRLGADGAEPMSAIRQAQVKS